MDPTQPSVCVHLRVHTHTPAGGSAGHSRADVATGPGEPGARSRGAGVTGWSGRAEGVLGNPLGPQSSACSLRALQMPWSLPQAKESGPYLFNV